MTNGFVHGKIREAQDNAAAARTMWRFLGNLFTRPKSKRVECSSKDSYVQPEARKIPGYALSISWKKCTPPKSDPGPWFREGSYYCHDGSVFGSYTYTNSCAMILSLETGIRHTVIDEKLARYEYDRHSTHRTNHKVVNTGNHLSSAQRRAILKRVTVLK